MKYPRTPHLPQSSATADGLVLDNSMIFGGKEVVVTVKMDGENTTMYRDHIHARSVNSGPHASRTWVKALHAGIKSDIPEGWRICGENLFATHSIRYENLTSYFQVFSVWNGDLCLSWKDTAEWVELLGLNTVMVLGEGMWPCRGAAIGAPLKQVAGDPCEGYVVRLASSFRYRDFQRSVAKCVRADHVQTDEHWMTSKMSVNGLRKDRSL